MPFSKMTNLCQFWCWGKKGWQQIRINENRGLVSFSPPMILKFAHFKNTMFALSLVGLGFIFEVEGVNLH